MGNTQLTLETSLNASSIKTLQTENTDLTEKVKILSNGLEKSVNESEDYKKQIQAVDALQKVNQNLKQTLENATLEKANLQKQLEQSTRLNASSIKTLQTENIRLCEKVKSYSNWESVQNEKKKQIQ